MTTTSRRAGHTYVPRRDALPEFTVYTDTGCEVSASCLKCPLAVCRYDVVGGIRSIRSEGRGGEIGSLLDEGLSFNEIAARLHVSARTIYRVLERRA